jgi:hypothetical protein
MLHQRVIGIARQPLRPHAAARSAGTVHIAFAVGKGACHTTPIAPAPEVQFNPASMTSRSERVASSVLRDLTEARDAQAVLRFTSTAASTRSWPPSAGDAGRGLCKRILMRLHRASLFVFVRQRDLSYTDNISERHLRPSTIFRKVTNGFCCEWGVETHAAFCSVVRTANANGASVLETVRVVLPAPRASQALLGVG